MKMNTDVMCVLGGDSNKLGRKDINGRRHIVEARR